SIAHSALYIPLVKLVLISLPYSLHQWRARLTPPIHQTGDWHQIHRPRHFFHVAPEPNGKTTGNSPEYIRRPAKPAHQDCPPPPAKSSVPDSCQTHAAQIKHELVGQDKLYIPISGAHKAVGFSSQQNFFSGCFAWTWG